ncbi:MAG TPA: hypothetical protein VKX16_03665 [Chloroflexota bacterium]|nr:hypothetical protein [Chloroflexota bacterium]
MKRLASTLLVATASAALLVSAPALASGTPPAGTAASTATASSGSGPTQSDPLSAAQALVNRSFDATCGRLTEVAGDHLTIRKAGGASVRVLVGPRTWFLTRGLENAQASVKQGEWAAAAGGDETTDGTALVVVYAQTNFCHRARPATRTFRGVVTGFDSTAMTLTISTGTTATTNQGTYTFGLTTTTRFYVNGKQVSTMPAFASGWQVRILAGQKTATSNTWPALKIWVVKTS